MTPARQWRLILAWLALAGAPFLCVAPWLLSLTPPHIQSDRFLRDDDIWALLGLTVAFALSPLAWRVAPRIKARLLISPRTWVIGAAGFVALIAWAGAGLVFSDYGLSRDEDMTGFGAAILSHGQAWASLAPQWRAYASALEPEFVRLSAGVTLWQPAYLPVNAALRAFAEAAGAATLVNPLLAAASVLATFAVGRRLWPERPHLALAAAILLATSSQMLTAAMTPYAMTGHLAFNLVWLWLHIRGGKAGHAAALMVGFLATGLHQLAFHPLFAAPFVLQLWLDRRWWVAGLYTVAYAAICLFWLDYAPLTLAMAGGAPAADVSGVTGLGGQVVALIQAKHPPALRLMAENLIRFITWQSVLAAPLAILGAAAAMKAGGTLRALVLGIVLTTAAMIVLMPYQGHGWGYRYLNGLLGSVALVAALGWSRLTDGLVASARDAARGLFAGAAVISLLVLFPAQAVLASAFVRPYAAAHRAINTARAEVVLVDTRGAWYIDDLVRNDPYLAGRPLVMRSESLTSDQIVDLCAHHSLATFDAFDAARFGIRVLADGRGVSLPAVCGPNRTPVRQITPDGRGQ